MSIFGLPLILFQVGVDEDVGDAEFLRDKEVAGDLINVFGTSLGTGDAVAFVPASGKTFFIYASSVNFTSIAASQHENIVELQNDGTIRDAVNLFIDDSPGLLSNTKPSFIILSDSLVGDGIKAYSIDVISNPNSDLIKGTIEGWIENT